jgi:hypothetical protein
MSIRITAIRKSNGYHSHEAIAQLKWINESTREIGIIDRVSLYNWIKKGGKAYVKDVAKDVALVGPRENLYGTQFVQTYADRTWRDNLLNLPSF